MRVKENVANGKIKCEADGMLITKSYIKDIKEAREEMKWHTERSTRHIKKELSTVYGSVHVSQ